MTDYNKKITEAALINPLWNLAVTLYKEGIIETDLLERLKQEKGKYCPEVARITVCNYLRDIERGATKPLT